MPLAGAGAAVGAAPAAPAAGAAPAAPAAEVAAAAAAVSEGGEQEALAWVNESPKSEDRPGVPRRRVILDSEEEELEEGV